MKVRLGIRTKFILIISVLLAAVLSLQFYFTNRIHRDIITEIEQITSSFNRTTDAYFFGDPEHKRSIILDEKKILKQKKDKVLELEKINDIFQNLSDSLNDEDLIEFHWKFEDMEKELGKVGEEVLKLKIHNQFQLPDSSSPDTKKVRVLSKRHAGRIEKFLLPNLDSLKQTLEKYEVNIDPWKKYQSESLNRWITQTQNSPDTDREPASFSFIIPDLTMPAEPRLLEYRYNTEEINRVIRKMRNRNAIITLTLFGLSIIAVAVIARRFLKPIRSLNQSFDRVVQGDLSVSVDSDARDEIGELTRSFNKMVSELKKNREKESLLRRKERLASLGQLAAGVAHEVKNPLNAINLTIEHLQDKFVDSKDDQASEYVKTIQSEIRRLDKTVNNFLNYIRSEQLERKNTDINDLIREILHLYERELASGHVEVKTELAPECVLKVDRERFKTALVNILLNAVQSVSGKGTITITTDEAERSITIQDTGCGIPDKDLDNIFDLFYTTKSTGTGLGLPTAYKIIKEHDGEVTIKSRVGKGTTVRIRIDVKDGK